MPIDQPKDSRVQVAIAILYREDKFLMQLRDNIPSIVHPGYWALFGGHLEAGETPEMAVVREVGEEIGYQMNDAVKFGNYDDDRVIRHVFAAPLQVELEQLNLMEGWDFDLLTPTDIARGEQFSQRANQIRPLTATTQRILLDFIEKKG